MRTVLHVTCSVQSSWECQSSMSHQSEGEDLLIHGFQDDGLPLVVVIELDGWDLPIVSATAHFRRLTDAGSM